MNQKFLIVTVKNPQDYIEREKHPLKRKAMEMNYRNYGSPISVSANTLQIDFKELHQLLMERLDHYKSHQ